MTWKYRFVWNIYQSFDSKDVYPHKNDKDLIYHAYKISALSVGEDDHNTVSTYDDIFEDVTIHVMIDDDGNDDDGD